MNDQVEELYDEHHFTDDEVFNIDETNNPTVVESPHFWKIFINKNSVNLKK